MGEMEAARFNVYWFLWLLVPAIIMLAATYRRRRWFLVVGVVLSLSATYALSNLAISEKWRIRNEIASTAQEQAVATADGANLVFTRFFFAPIEAVVVTLLWGLAGCRFWPRARNALGIVPNTSFQRTRVRGGRGLGPLNSER